MEWDWLVKLFDNNHEEVSVGGSRKKNFLVDQPNKQGSLHGHPNSERPPGFDDFFPRTSKHLLVPQPDWDDLLSLNPKIQMTPTPEPKAAKQGSRSDAPYLFTVPDNQSPADSHIRKRGGR
jgi:hypothetical protein